MVMVVVCGGGSADVAAAAGGGDGRSGLCGGCGGGRRRCRCRGRGDGGSRGGGSGGGMGGGGRFMRLLLVYLKNLEMTPGNSVERLVHRYQNYRTEEPLLSGWRCCALRCCVQ